MLLAFVAPAAVAPAEGLAKPKDDKGKQVGVGGNGKVDGKFLRQLKETLEASDDEWRVLEPRVARVVLLQTESEAGIDPDGPKKPKQKDVDKARAIASGTVPGKDGGGAAVVVPPTDVRLRSAELAEAWHDQASPVGLLKARLATVQASRRQARQQLAVAREDLRGLLTVRQEAILSVLGVLD
jgi:hypothetical protein